MVESGIAFGRVMAAGRTNDVIKDLVIRGATEERPHIRMAHQMGAMRQAAADLQFELADGDLTGSRLNNAGMDRPDSRLERPRRTDPAQPKGPSQLSLEDQLSPGSVWFVSSYLLSGGDVKDERPVVIVQGPRSDIAIVIIWARTTDTTMKGILTPAGVLDGLNKDGVFSPRHQHSMDVSRLREPVCRYMGHLPEPYRTDVLSEWERL